MKKIAKKMAFNGMHMMLDATVIICLQMLGLFQSNVEANTPAFSYSLIFILFIAVFKILILTLYKVYKMITDNFGIVESMRVMIISLASSILLFIVMFIIPDRYVVSYSWSACILILVSEVFLLASIRYVRRVFKIYLGSSKNQKTKRTMVIGAGGGGKLVFDETRTNDSINNKIVVFVDDEESKIGATFANIPIEGPLSNIVEIIDKYKCEEVIIAIANLSKERLFEILRLLEGTNTKIKRLPLMSELDSTKKRQVIEVNISELLCRDSVALDNNVIKDLILGNIVMVTGAGGSIGSELARQIFSFKPKMLILFDIYENGIYDVQQSLFREMRKNNIHDIELITLIGATYNEQRMETIFDKYRPSLVFHAAAYKHVPLMEDSPGEAIRTNVIGTYNVAKLCDKYNVKKMVLVSTDKAVRPTNVMGATKRFAELIIQYFGSVSKMNYSAVRFGNVLGSNGSVIPLFKKQIEEGGPVTVTDANMTRFFMTISESVGLILQSGAYANGGEIFILDMGKPVKILDLAEKMIRQAGYMPYRDVKIEFIGMRPGEKLYEELLLEVSGHTKTANNKIFIEAKEQNHPIEDEIKKISQAFTLTDNQEIKNLLKQIIVTYKEPVHT